MSSPAKFMFDIDFAAPKAANTIALAEHQVQLGEAESRGYRNGFSEGQREAQGETARRLAIAMEDIAHTLDRLARGLSIVEKRVEAEAVEVAVATGRKLASELVAREPFAEIQALAIACFRDLVATPHVVVRLNDALYEDAQTRLADIARKVGFDGRLLVLAEPDIGVGDCKIEWADGGMTRDHAAADHLIGETVRRFLEGRRMDAEQHVKGTSDE
ncbi:MAG: FliH/SctL family protein [Pseudorhodoplanes sp.]